MLRKHRRGDHAAVNIDFRLVDKNQSHQSRIIRRNKADERTHPFFGGIAAVGRSAFCAVPVLPATSKPSTFAIVPVPPSLVTSFSIDANKLRGLFGNHPADHVGLVFEQDLALGTHDARVRHKDA